MIECVVAEPAAGQGLEQIDCGRGQRAEADPNYRAKLEAKVAGQGPQVTERPMPDRSRDIDEIKDELLSGYYIIPENNEPFYALEYCVKLIDWYAAAEQAAMAESEKSKTIWFNTAKEVGAQLSVKTEELGAAEGLISTLEDRLAYVAAAAKDRDEEIRRLREVLERLYDQADEANFAPTKDCYAHCDSCDPSFTCWRHSKDCRHPTALQPTNKSKP